MKASATPYIVRDTVISTTGAEEHYTIFAESGTIDDLAISDIIQIKKSLEHFILLYDKEHPSITPIQITIPFKDNSFVPIWNEWKAYLKESHNKMYPSRQEQKVLEHLFAITEGKIASAKEILDTAMREDRFKF